MTVTLIYWQSGTSYSHDFSALFVKGQDSPDKFLIVGVQHKLLNGSVVEQIRGINRVIELDFGIISDPSERYFLSNFLLSPQKEVHYLGNIALVVLGEG